MMELRNKQNDQSLRYPCSAGKKRIESSGNEIGIQSPFMDLNFPKLNLRVFVSNMWIANYFNLLRHLILHMHMPQEFNHFGWENLARESARINSRNIRPPNTIFVTGSTHTEIEQWISLTIQSPDQLCLDSSGTWVAFKRFPSAVGELPRFSYSRPLFRVRVAYFLCDDRGDSCVVKSAYPVV